VVAWAVVTWSRSLSEAKPPCRGDDWESGAKESDRDLVDTEGGAKANVAHGARSWAEDAELGQQHRRRPPSASMSRRCERTASIPRAAASTMAAYPTSRFARTPSRTKLSGTRLRTAPERSRVHPFAFARLRMAVSERLCGRPIPGR
jgi:hypothetical protein